MSASEYYDHTTYPANGAFGSSSALRTELESIETGFGKLPDLAGNGGKAVLINAGGTAMETVATTGTGSVVRATSPTLVTPILGVATATSINKVAITAPATSATLTLAEGSTLATSGANSLTLTTTGATNVTLPTTGTLATLAGSETLTNKTLTSPTISGGTIDNCVIGGTTAAAATVTTLTVSNQAFVQPEMTVYENAAASHVMLSKRTTLGLRFRLAAGTYASPTVLLTPSGSGVINAEAYSGSAYATLSQIQIGADGYSGGGYLAVNVAPAGSTTLAEAFRIEENKVITLGGNETTSCVLKISPSASNVNYLQVTGGASGTAVTLSAQGDAPTLGIVIDGQANAGSAHLTIKNTGATAGANLRFIGDGATTPNKTIRVNAGVLQVLDSGYANAILALTDAGRMMLGTVTDDTTSSLQTPAAIATGGAFISKATSSTAWNLDMTKNSATGYTAITAAGTYDIAQGSGYVFIHNDSTGLMAVFLCYAGSVVKIGGDATIVSGAPGASQIGLAYNGGTTSYRVTNGYATTQNVFVSGIRTRFSS